MSNFYYEHNANVHRGIHKTAEKSTELYEEARNIVAHFIHAKSNLLESLRNFQELIIQKSEKLKQKD